MPQVWPLIRLPVLVVLAYSLSVVDMALILGPSNPPTLAVLLTRLFSDPDLGASCPPWPGAGATGPRPLAFALLWLAERVVAQLGLVWLRRGGRGSSARTFVAAGHRPDAGSVPDRRACDAGAADLVAGMALELAHDPARKLVVAGLDLAAGGLGAGVGHDAGVGADHDCPVPDPGDRLAGG